MTERDEVHLDIDPMIFLAAVIEQELEVIEMMTAGEAMFPVPGLGEGVANVAREHIEKAQVALDNLIAEDETWHEPH